MIINHQYKFIFVKTRKTASTSTEIALSQFCGADDIITRIEKSDEATRRECGFRGPQNFDLPLRSYDYLDWKRLVQKHRRKRFSSHVSASFIRQNAGEKVWNSYFKFCFERNPFDKAISRYYWNTRPPSPRPAMTDFINRAGTRALSSWDIYTVNDHIAVDFVGRYEALNDDLARIVKILDLPSAIELPRAKAQFRENRDHYSKVLSPQARARIELVCAKEMTAFGYAWEDSDRA